MRRDLTDAFLRALKPPASGRLELWDSRVRGLCFRITAAGAAAWTVRGRTADGRHTRVTLGTYPALGLSEARRAALDTLASLQRGADPVAQKRQARAKRAAERAEPSVAERLAQWQDAKRARWSDRHAAEVARLAARDIAPRLGKRPASPDDPRRLGGADRSEGTHRARRRCIALPRRLGLPEPCRSRRLDRCADPAAQGAATLAPPPRPRERTLTDDELRLLWQASAAEAPKPRAFVRLLILTAAREAEVAGLRAGEVDLAAGRWNLPAARTKNGRPLTVPLGDLALAELRAVWPVDDPPETHCLLGRFPSSPLSGFSKLKARIDVRMAALAERAGLPVPAPWRFHDLRRTARSGMARLGVPNDHAEAALNHISGRPALARVYDRHDYQREAIAALTTWQAFVAGLVGDGAEVVALAERRRATLVDAG
jgi:integrase